MKKNCKIQARITEIEIELIFRVNYGETKFHQSIKYKNTQPVKFSTLKTKICEQLKNLNQIQSDQFNQIKLVDSQDYQFLDSENINTFLKNNDIVNVKLCPLQQNINQLNKIEEQKQQLLLASEPKEAICVLYDTSGSMSKSYFADKELSRIGAVNSWFSAFADKTLAFEKNHIIQLICFASDVQVKCEFNNDFEKFITLVNDVQAKGSSQLYAAIDQAITNLIKIKQQYPNIILRIIALTDGEDNQSSSSLQNLVQRIIENKIIIDSFVVSENCTGLKALTHASGGRCYCPKELSIGMQLFEIETILSVEARDASEVLNPLIDLSTLQDKPFDTEGIRQSAIQSRQGTVYPQVIIKKIEEQQNACLQPLNSIQAKRVHKELISVTKQPLDQFKIFPTKDDLSYWKAFLIAPQDSIYNQGLYLISIEFPRDFPFKPPKIRFLTQISHCNISSQGLICLDTIRDKWTPTLKISDVLLQILNLLKNPNRDEALDSIILSQMLLDPEKFKKTVIEQTSNQKFDTIVQQAFGQDINEINSGEFSKFKNEIETWRNKYKA